MLWLVGGPACLAEVGPRLSGKSRVFVFESILLFSSKSADLSSTQFLLLAESLSQQAVFKPQSWHYCAVTNLPATISRVYNLSTQNKREINTASSKQNCPLAWNLGCVNKMIMFRNVSSHALTHVLSLKISTAMSSEINFSEFISISPFCLQRPGDASPFIVPSALKVNSGWESGLRWDCEDLLSGVFCLWLLLPVSITHVLSECTFDKSVSEPSVPGSH